MVVPIRSIYSVSPPSTLEVEQLGILMQPPQPSFLEEHYIDNEGYVLHGQRPLPYQQQRLRTAASASSNSTQALQRAAVFRRPNANHSNHNPRLAEHRSVPNGGPSAAHLPLLQNNRSNSTNRAPRPSRIPRLMTSHNIAALAQEDHLRANGTQQGHPTLSTAISITSNALTHRASPMDGHTSSSSGHSSTVETSTLVSFARSHAIHSPNRQSPLRTSNFVGSAEDEPVQQDEPQQQQSAANIHPTQSTYEPQLQPFGIHADAYTGSTDNYVSMEINDESNSIDSVTLPTPNRPSTIMRPFCGTDVQFKRWLRKYSKLCQLPIESVPNSRNYVPLCFTVKSIRCGTFTASNTFDQWWDSILMDDEVVYTIPRASVVNILLEYCGEDGPKNDDDSHNSASSGTSLDFPRVTISKIVLKTNKFANFGRRFQQGMVFASHNAIDISDTSCFDWFSKGTYDRYKATMNRTPNRRRQGPVPVAWFDCNSKTQHNLTDPHDERTMNCVIDIGDRSAKYVMLKFLIDDDITTSASSTSAWNTSSTDGSFQIRYVGLFGYSGARAFLPQPRYQ